MAWATCCCFSFRVFPSALLLVWRWCSAQKGVVGGVLGSAWLTAPWNWRIGIIASHTKFFYVKSAQICRRQPSRLNVILFAFPDHSQTEKFSDVS